MKISIAGFINSISGYLYPLSPVAQMQNNKVESKPMTIVEEHDGHPVLDKRPGIFATALAHEVRNPLTNISMAAEILRGENLNEEQKTYVEIIQRGTERISKLITEFLNSHKALEMEPEMCSINELLDEVIEVNEDRVLLKNVLIIKDYEAGPLNVHVTRAEIKIALINVIVNAIEALPPENGILKLVTGSSNGMCSITIEDNGMGITDVNLVKIFDPYFTNKPGGMGLGLSTTKNIMATNGGSMHVQSAIGSGSSFTFSFQKMH